MYKNNKKNVRTTCVPDTLLCSKRSSFVYRIPSRCAYILKHVRKQFCVDKTAFFAVLSPTTHAVKCGG